MPNNNKSVDMFATKKHSSSIFFNQLEEEKKANLKHLTLSPIDFFCERQDIVKAVADHISNKFKDDMLRKDKRREIEQESYKDIRKLFIDQGITAQEDLLVQYMNLILADILGFGVLESLLNNPDITEIMVKSHDCIYVEQKVGNKSEMVKTGLRFPSVDNAIGIVNKIIGPLNLTINNANPNVNAQLPDGSRLSASIPPLRANGEVSITIRKFSSKVYDLTFYQQKGSSTKEMVQFLEAAVKTRNSMLVSGGTGSGKTTLLNSLSYVIPEKERILTCEDTLELQLQQEHVESYQTILPNMEGKGGFNMRQIIIEALRKRPDRIIVGECRGGEIVEMLNAMNTGHEGSLSTVHANNPRDMVQRVMTMILSNESTSGLPPSAIMQMLASALDLIVQTNRLSDGSRKITNITEVVGSGEIGLKKLQSKGFMKNTAEADENRLYLQDIFKFEQTSVDEDGTVHGQFVTTGYIPYCAEKIRKAGVYMPDEFFEKRVLFTV